MCIGGEGGPIEDLHQFWIRIAQGQDLGYGIRIKTMVLLIVDSSGQENAYKTYGFLSYSILEMLITPVVFFVILSD